MTLTSETASGFYYWFDANYFKKYVTAIFPKFSGLAAFLA